MAADEAGGKQHAEAVTDRGHQRLHHRQRHRNGQAELNKKHDHAEEEVAGNTAQLLFAAFLAAALAEPVQADDGEHRNDQQTRIRAHGIGKVNDVQELAAQQQPQKTGQHTGGDKELLEKRDLGPQDQ